MKKSQLSHFLTVGALFLHLIIVVFVLLYLLHRVLILVVKYFVHFVQFFVQIDLNPSLQPSLGDDLLEILVVKVLGLQVAIGGYGAGGGRYYDVLRALKVLGDLVEEGLPRILYADREGHLRVH